MILTVQQKQLFENIWQQALKIWKQLTWILRGENMKIPRSQRSTTYKCEFFKPRSQFLSCTSKELQPAVHGSVKNLFTFPAIAFGLHISAALCDFFSAASSKIPEFRGRNVILHSEPTCPLCIYSYIFLHRLLYSCSPSGLQKLFTFRLKIHHHKNPSYASWVLNTLTNFRLWRIYFTLQ